MTSEIRRGDRIKDNDPRMASRVLTVTDIDIRYVYGVRGEGARVFRILRNRVYTDGKPRRTGFSRVEAALADLEGINAAKL